MTDIEPTFFCHVRFSLQYFMLCVVPISVCASQGLCFTLCLTLEYMAPGRPGTPEAQGLRSVFRSFEADHLFRRMITRTNITDHDDDVDDDDDDDLEHVKLFLLLQSCRSTCNFIPHRPRPYQN